MIGTIELFLPKQRRYAIFLPLAIAAAVGVALLVGYGANSYIILLRRCLEPLDFGGEFASSAMDGLALVVTICSFFLAYALVLRTRLVWKPAWLAFGLLLYIGAFAYVGAFHIAMFDYRTCAQSQSAVVVDCRALPIQPILARMREAMGIGWIPFIPYIISQSVALALVPRIKGALSKHGVRFKAAGVVMFLFAFYLFCFPLVPLLISLSRVVLLLYPSIFLFFDILVGAEINIATGLAPVALIALTAFAPLAMLLAAFIMELLSRSHYQLAEKVRRKSGLLTTGITLIAIGATLVPQSALKEFLGPDLAGLWNTLLGRP